MTCQEIAKARSVVSHQVLPRGRRLTYRQYFADSVKSPRRHRRDARSSAECEGTILGVIRGQDSGSPLFAIVEARKACNVWLIFRLRSVSIGPRTACIQYSRPRP